MKMEILVKGMVERTVSVEGDSIKHGVANAKKEWSALTGGDLTTAETAYEEYVDESKLDSQTKQEVFTALTKLYYVCDNNGWSRMAGAISMAEDVARQEADDLRLKETGGES